MFKKLKRPAATAQHHPNAQGLRGEGIKIEARGGRSPGGRGSKTPPLPQTADHQSLFTAFSPQPPLCLRDFRHRSPQHGREETKRTARRSTGDTPGNGKRHHQLRSGHLRGQSPERSRSTSEARKSRARAHTTREGHAPRRVNHPPPARGRGPSRTVNRARAGAPDASTGTPRTTARSARGSAIRPDSRTPDFHTPPSKDGEERRGARWQNEKSGRHSQ